MTEHAELRRQNLETIARWRSATYHGVGVADAASAVFAPDALVQLAFPFETVGDGDDLVGDVYGQLLTAMPEAERRDWIVMSGTDVYGHEWVGCGGHYTGTFTAPFLDIPPTNRLASFRYHEFFRMVDGKVVEVQGLWDLPELMMQAGVWPMSPSLGRDWQVPGPASNDGDRTALPSDPEHTAGSRDWVVGMLGDMGKHPTEPEETMRLEHWWHPKFNWYGPAGIGSSRGATGFRRHHQIPFLAAMPDRRGGYQGDSHFFGDEDYVGVTAWPGMSMTVSGAGWLGIPPTDQAITMRSLDFWRLETDPTTGARSIRENWVLVDLLHVYDQLGVDVLARMRELF